MKTIIIPDIQALDAVRHAVRAAVLTMTPDLQAPLGHYTEAIACGFSHRNNAALRTTLKAGSATVALDRAGFRRRMTEFGHVLPEMTDAAFVIAVIEALDAYEANGHEDGLDGTIDAVPTRGSDIWERVSNADCRRVAEWLLDQKLDVVIAVISKIDQEASAEILSRFGREFRSSVMQSIARLSAPGKGELPDASHIEKVEHLLSTSLMSHLMETAGPEHGLHVSGILDQMPPDMVKEFMADLSNDAREGKKPFHFDNFEFMDLLSIAEVVRRTPRETLVLALRRAPTGVVRRFQATMDASEYSRLRDAIDALSKEEAAGRWKARGEMEKIVGTLAAYGLLSSAMNQTGSPHPFSSGVQQLLMLKAESPVGLFSLEGLDMPSLLRNFMKDDPIAVAAALASVPSDIAGWLITQINFFTVRAALKHMTDDEIAAIFRAASRQKMRVKSENGEIELSDAIRMLIHSIAEKDGDLANRLWPLAFGFHDIVRLDGVSIQILTRHIETATLALALKECDEDVKKAFFMNMSERQERMMEAEIDALGVVRMRDVTEAQAEIVRIALALADDEEIVIGDTIG